MREGMSRAHGRGDRVGSECADLEIVAFERDLGVGDQEVQVAAQQRATLESLDAVWRISRWANSKWRRAITNG